MDDALSPPPTPRPRRWRRGLGWAVAAVALLAVFLAYLNPHLAVDLAGRLWACF